MSAAYFDSELKDDYVDYFPDGTVKPVPKAPKGTSLPITPDFKANLIARYSFPAGAFNAYTQGTFAYQTSTASELELADNAVYGDIPSSTFVNFAFGVEKDKYSVELFVSNATNEDATLGVTSECTPQVCGVQTKGVKARPRTIGIRFTQDF